MSEEEILDIKRENYKLRKENFELIQENEDLVNEKEKLKNDLLEVTNKLGFKIQELENSISKDKIKEVIEKIEAYYRMAEGMVQDDLKKGYAYSPLNQGRKEAHLADADFVKELLGE